MDYAKVDAFLCNELYKRISIATAKEIKDAEALISAAKKVFKTVNKQVGEATFVDTLLRSEFCFGSYNYKEHMGNIDPALCKLARALFMFENLEIGMKEIRRIVDAAK